MEFKITVSKRIAKTTSTESLICGNDGDTLTVTFDDEWANISAKTARLVWIKGGEYTYIDVPFTGTSCPLPAVIQAKMLFVGFFAGDSTENTLKTSTPAQIPCISSILDVPAEAFTPDVYRNILDIIANKVDKVTGKGLSTNDYTDSAKSFLEETVPEQIDRIDAKIAEVEANVYSNFKNKVDKVAGKGLSTNDYTDAEKAEVAKVAGKLDKPTNVIEGLFGFNSVGVETIKEITSAGVSVDTDMLNIPNNKALKEYVAAKNVNFLSKPTSNGIVGYMSGIGSFSYTLNTSMPEKPLHTGILSAKAVYDYINSLDAREVSY